MYNTLYDIELWLKRHEIRNYTVVKQQGQLVVNVAGSVEIRRAGIKEIAVQFGEVVGDFDCSINELSSLKGSPRTVKGNFYCTSNQLTTLEHGPLKVTESYYCFGNKLISLAGVPEKLKEFNASQNQLKNLQGGPKKVKTTYRVFDNPFDIADNDKDYDFQCEQLDISHSQPLPGLEKYYVYTKGQYGLSIKFRQFKNYLLHMKLQENLPENTKISIKKTKL